MPAETDTGGAATTIGIASPFNPRRTLAISEDVYRWFYRVERRGAATLSDGGGPFGFDIISALQVDYLIARYNCDAIVETGCHMGDTTEYLALRYPDIPVISCDIDTKYAGQTRDRLADYANVSVRQADSPDVVEEANSRYERPFYYLDAHGSGDWPLSKEVGAIDKGVVCIDDFDIGHERYDYDTYNGVPCGPAMLSPFRERIPFYYVVNLNGIYPFPCLQMGRRSGRCFYAVGMEHDHFAESDYFVWRVNQTDDGPN